MRKGVCLVLAVLLVAVSAAQEFGGGSRQPNAGDYAGETVGALLGGGLVGAGATAVLAIVGIGVATAASPNDGWAGLGGLIVGGAAGAALGYPLGCGLGTTIAGKAVRVEGNTGAAYGGAYAGMVLGAMAGLISQSWEVAIPAMIVLPPAGAVIGHNTGVQRTSSSSSLGARLSPPALALCTRPGPDRQRHLGFDCRLLTMRF